MIPKELLTKNDFYPIYERLTKERDAWMHHSEHSQQEHIVANERIKELEGIIEQGLAYVNHLEEENFRMKRLLKLGLNEGWELEHEREAKDLVYGSPTSRGNNNS